MNSPDFEVRIAGYLRGHETRALSAAATEALNRDRGYLWRQHDTHTTLCVPADDFHRYFGIPRELWDIYPAKDIVTIVRIMVFRLRIITERSLHKGLTVTYRVPGYTMYPVIREIGTTKLITLSDTRVVHPLWIWPKK